MDYLQGRIIRALAAHSNGLTVAELHERLVVEQEAVERALGGILRFVRIVPTRDETLYYLLNGAGLLEAERIPA